MASTAKRRKLHKSPADTRPLIPLHLVGADALIGPRPRFYTAPSILNVGADDSVGPCRAQTRNAEPFGEIVVR